MEFGPCRIGITRPINVLCLRFAIALSLLRIWLIVGIPQSEFSTEVAFQKDDTALLCWW